MLGEEREKDYTDVSLFPDAAAHFFIDRTAVSSLFHALAMLVCLFLMHCYAAYRAPRLFTTERKFIKLNATTPNLSVDIDITLSQLRPQHRFIAVNCTLISWVSDRFRSLPIEFSTRRTTTKETNVQTAVASHPLNHVLQFTPGSNASTTFEVAHLSISEFDSLKLRVSIQTDYSSICGFLFVWRFANVNVEKYRNLAKLLLSFLVGYMFLIFCIHLKRGPETFTHIFLIVLGVSGLFACNPMNFFRPEPEEPRFGDDALMSAFIGLYRLFLMCQLDLLKSGTSRLRLLCFSLFLLFFAVYATVDSRATYDRRCRMFRSEEAAYLVLDSATNLMWMHALYLSLSMVYLLIAIVMHDQGAHRRLWLFGLSVFVTDAATLVVEVILVVTNMWTDSIAPQMLFAVAHATMAAMTLFLMHSGGDPEYKSIGENAASIELGIDEASESSGGKEGFTL
jgi:hypothetical protein